MEYAKYESGGIRMAIEDSEGKEIMKLSALCLLYLTIGKVIFVHSTDLIEHLRVHKNRLDVVINKEFKQAYLREDFFVEYDDDVDLEKLDASLVSLPFIMNVISLVWISGNDYYIDSLDQEVYESLERIKKIFTVFYPKTGWNGRLIPRKLVRNKTPINTDSDHIALLFSGGVDSTSSSFAHRSKPQLLITAWGQSCLPHNKPAYQKMKKHFRSYAELYGHANAFIESNYYYFLNHKKVNNLSPEIGTWRTNTIEDLGWAGLIAPLLIHHHISKAYIASSDTWNFPYPSAANPYIDGCLSFAGIRIKHDQFDFSRYDKLQCIVNLCRHHFVARPTLIVCQKKGGMINCGHCEKCLLSCLCLFTLGENPQDYGFSLTLAEAQKFTQQLFASGKISSNGIWQFTDLQKKIRNKHQTHLNWLRTLAFHTVKPYDIKKTKKVDWELLKQLFPEIKVKKNSAMHKICLDNAESYKIEEKEDVS